MTYPSAGSRPSTADDQQPRQQGTGRARPLPPEERRAALVAATLPLVTEHGTKVTTRQIAEAAGVAEGTIFRVFPDKESLVRAAVEAALDPEPLLDVLHHIDLTLPLQERLTLATHLLQNRMTRVINLLMVLRLQRAERNIPVDRAAARDTNNRIQEAFVRLLEPDRENLRYPVAEAARLLRMLTFSGVHPMNTEGNPLTAGQIVSVLLDGVRRHPDHP
ncbi:TetR/AcrR family transcriptional regulator [Planosporangium sp. 12N6]|uniref:TetR/AcrR family transcriptional regulator n=1 Tax=Planosporangium spinosum TaxID=3402278 RepID=UPI003CF308B9